MKREVVLTILCAVLFAALITFAMFGCGCTKTKEGFQATEGEKSKETPSLTPQEEELFQDIQTGNLNDDDIQKLVESGKITEQMVEKFLQYLDNMPDPTETEEPGAAAKKSVKKAPIVPTSEEGFDIEAFTGTMYAPAK